MSSCIINRATPIVKVDQTYSGTSTNAQSGVAVKQAIDALDVTTSGMGAGKTLSALTQTDGKISATYQDISITTSQVSDFPNIPAGTVTSVRVQATSPVTSSTSTAQTSSLNTTIALADNYGDTKNPYASKTKSYVLAAPSDKAGVPSFRALVAADLPTVTVAKGGTGVATAGANKVFAGPSSGTSAGAPSFRALVAADIPAGAKFCGIDTASSAIKSGTTGTVNWTATQDCWCIATGEPKEDEFMKITIGQVVVAMLSSNNNNYRNIATLNVPVKSGQVVKITGQTSYAFYKVLA